MTFIDTHTHCSDAAFRGEEDALIEGAVAAGVEMMLQADVDSRERGAMLALVKRHPAHLRAMLGLYPGSVDREWKREFDAVVEALRDEPAVALGEIGLDYHYGGEFRSEQMEAFHAQLELAASLDLPVNIHLRDATDDFFKVLDGVRHLGIRGNLHAYSGSWETFLRVQRYGDWRIGVGGVVTFRNASLAETVRKVPLERILLETDAPYLTPVPFRGQRNDSSKIPVIAAKVAELQGVSIEEVAEVTTRSAKELFAI